jgi:E3 ubiquitin-protein ligase RGLG
LKAYRSACTTLELSGPTSFAPSIDYAIKQVNDSGGEYHILLLLTDGCVSTMLGCHEATRASLVRASEVALSIVIVGVGDGPWEEMNDMDDGLPERSFDNVQFVQYTPIAKALESGTPAHVCDNAFSIAALQEIPAQFATINTLGLLEKRKGRGASATHEHGEADDNANAKRQRVE